MGSARRTSPPWGGDTRLGDRVLKHVLATLETRTATLGGDTITYDVSVLDPIDVFGPNGALSEISSGEFSVPTFFMKDLPPPVKAMKQLIIDADAYIIVSPEYNHSAPPALSSLMGHFGGSCYAGKPSGIITYSPGPYGGMRAAMAIQVIAHELGCLPVSKLCGLSYVSDILNVDGTAKDNNTDRMLKQLPDMLTQLDWMAVAMKRQRDLTGVF